MGALFSFVLYRKKKNTLPSTNLFFILVGLRFLVGSLLSFLLLSPILKYLQHTEEKPCIAFIQDNSASEKFAFKKIDSVLYRKNVTSLIKELEKDYVVRTFSIGNSLKDSLKFDYADRSTDISSSLETIMTTLESNNLSGIVLASDGIYNQGPSPLSMAYPFKGAIFTVGIGDTTIQKDALIARVFANKIVYLGDQFAIRSDLAAFSCKGTRIQVSVFSHQANRMIFSQQLDVNDDRFSKSIETIVDAKSAGVQHYTISVSKLDGEQNIVNNSQDVYVEVMDNKEKILILANAPHPDLFALRDALSKNKNYQVTVQTADKASNIKANEYNLIVLHNLPSTKYQSANLIDMAKKSGTSIWYITGNQTAIPLFNNAQNCLQIASRGMGNSDAQAMLNQDFSFFTLTKNNSLQQLPPLSAAFGEFKAGPSTQVLMNQRVGNVTTNYPLWILQQNNGSKVGVTAGEGLWRWRMYDFNQHKNHNLVDEYIIKTAQFLAVKHDQKQFRTQLQKNVFIESEQVVLDAELYNENFELINVPEVNLQLTDEQGKKNNYSLNKNDHSYSLNLGNLAAGKYSYTANTSWNSRNLSSSGNFTVIAQNIEEINTRADFGLLNQLATNYGGSFVFADQVGSLKDLIKKHPAIKTIIRSSIQTEPLINWKCIFGFLIFLLALEWFLRKRSGLY